MSISSDVGVDSAEAKKMMLEFLPMFLLDESWIQTVDLTAQFHTKNSGLFWGEEERGISVHRTKNYSYSSSIDSEALMQQAASIAKYSGTSRLEVELTLQKIKEFDYLFRRIEFDKIPLFTSEVISPELSSVKECLSSLSINPLLIPSLSSSLSTLIFPDGCPEDPQTAEALLLEFCHNLGRSDDLKLLQFFQATLPHVEKKALQALECLKVIKCYDKVMSTVRETPGVTGVSSLEFTVIIGSKSNPHHLSRACYSAKEGRPGTWTIDKILPSEENS